MGHDVALLSATELVARYRAQQLSPVEVTQAVLDRIERLNLALNAFCVIDAESALESARLSEERWHTGAPLGLVDGVPTTIKDAFLTKGWPTRRGSKTISPDGPWVEDSPAVARLRAHGAVLVGKTTAPEFSWKGVTHSPIYGITRNPWNTEQTPGGSSGGAAAAAAAGMGALHLGGDGGGSVRNPASFSGVYGLKPTTGRVPFYPNNTPGSIGAVGPLTRSVADLALALNVIAEPDSRDWWALPFEARDYRVGLEAGVHGLRVGFSRDFGYAEVDPEVASVVAGAADKLSQLGAHVEEANPGFDSPFAAQTTFFSARYAYLMRGLSAEKRELLDPGLRDFLDRGATKSVSDILEADAVRAELGRCMGRFHERYDLLVTPQVSVPAFEAGCDYPKSRGMTNGQDWKVFSYPFNLTGQPAACVAVGCTGEGLPVGMQIVGPPYAEALVLRAARACESMRPFAPPPLAIS